MCVLFVSLVLVFSVFCLVFFWVCVLFVWVGCFVLVGWLGLVFYLPTVNRCWVDSQVSGCVKGRIFITNIASASVFIVRISNNLLAFHFLKGS